MYERRHYTLISRARFLRRMVSHSGAALILLGGSLACGMWGYWYFEKLLWLDASLNASMLLGGEGPILAPKTTGGKLFAGVYALYSGMIVLAAASIILAPLMHRFLHRFHLEDDQPRQP